MNFHPIIENQEPAFNLQRTYLGKIQKRILDISLSEFCQSNTAFNLPVAIKQLNDRELNGQFIARIFLVSSFIQSLNNIFTYIKPSSRSLFQFLHWLSRNEVRHTILYILVFQQVLFNRVIINQSSNILYSG